MAFNIPSDLLNTEVYNGCPPGYIRVGDSCVHPLTEEIIQIAEATEYEFEYHQNCGELIGRYILSSPKNIEVPSIYFSQNIKAAPLYRVGINDPETILNKNDNVLFKDFTHTKNSGLLDINLDEYFTSDIADFRNTFVFGEFHLITNLPHAIHRINLNYSLRDATNTKYQDWPNLNGIPLPTLLEVDKSASFLEFYLGYSKIPTLDRPFEFIEDSQYKVTPTFKHPLKATDRLNWKTLRETCFRWTRIYDKSNIGDKLALLDLRPGHYLCQIKCVINEAKLKAFMNSAVDASTYINGVPKEFKIIFYPPSMNLYQVDSVTNVVEPGLNAINPFVDRVIFKAPQNYKTDGNIHFRLVFLTDKSSEDILFSTSSYEFFEDFEAFQWSVSKDNKTWKQFSSATPTFNNNYEEENGMDSEQIKYIKYQLSDNIKQILKDKADISFRIYQLDGTKRVN